MSKPVDLLVYRQYELYGIKIVVEINRLNKTVSIVERDDSHSDTLFKNKEWVFAEREIQYMDGWIAIFRAMEHAISEAKKELEAFKDEDIDKLIKIFVSLDKVKLENVK